MSVVGPKSALGSLPEFWPILADQRGSVYGDRLAWYDAKSTFWKENQILWGGSAMGKKDDTRSAHSFS